MFAFPRHSTYTHLDVLEDRRLRSFFRSAKRFSSFCFPAARSVSRCCSASTAALASCFLLRRRPGLDAEKRKKRTEKTGRGRPIRSGCAAARRGRRGRNSSAQVKRGRTALQGIRKSARELDRSARPWVLAWRFRGKGRQLTLLCSSTTGVSLFYLSSTIPGGVLYGLGGRRRPAW